jgi:Trk-type K+ transport systems, membrane components
MHRKAGLNWKFILRAVGFIIIIESLFLLISAGISFYFQESASDDLLLSGIVTLVVGLVMIVSLGKKLKYSIISKKESYLTVALSWFVFALFGAVPFLLCGATPSFADAFFESTSGITTTGASIMNDIDSLPKGLLFWRSISQWLGGMGIIVFSLALLPLLGGGTSQLFDAEVTGISHDKFQPRITQVAKRLWIIYLGLTAAVITLLYVGPMGLFDAFCHGFSTISTGGFSTKQASLAYWDSTFVESVVSIFMLFGAINFTLLYFLFFKGDFKRFVKDEELRWFIGIIVITSIIIGGILTVNSIYPFDEAFRKSAFHVISVITTTGFTTANFTEWGSFLLLVFMFLMIVCGCAGSTSGGLKIIRIVVLIKNTLMEFKRSLHPRAIIPVRLNGKALSFNIVQRLMAFVFLYIATIFVSWAVLTFIGMPFDEALGAAVTAIGNVGPGFGETAITFSHVPAFAKWYLSFLMIVGRLELFTVLILFTPAFWKK